jgi:hypothetical protein
MTIEGVKDTGSAAKDGNALPTLNEIVETLEEGAAGRAKEDPPVVIDPVVDVKPAEPIAPPEKPKDPLATKFAALARREKEARMRADEIEARSKVLEARERELSERDAARASAKRPLDILKAHGLTYQDATQDVLGGYTPPEPDPVDTKLGERLTPFEQRLQQLETENTKLKELAAQVEQDRVQRYIQDVQKGIRETASSGDYELIQSIGDEAYTLVQDVIGEFFKKHKRLLSYAEACATVESHYQQKFVTPFAKTKKMQALLKAEMPPPAATPARKEVREKPTTLTQSHSTSVAKPLSGVDHLPKHEALAELAKHLTFNND